MANTLTRAETLTFDGTSAPDLVDAAGRAIARLVVVIIVFSLLLSLVCVTLVAPGIRWLRVVFVPRRLT